MSYLDKNLAVLKESNPKLYDYLQGFKEKGELLDVKSVGKLQWVISQDYRFPEITAKFPDA